MSTAFDLLREAREQHHLSLSDVADATLINVDYLRAIEQGRLDVLPQPYVRAFMREYAAVVGLDPAALMERLDRDQAAIAAPSPAAEAAGPGKGVVPKSPDAGETPRGAAPERPAGRAAPEASPAMQGGEAAGSSGPTSAPAEAAPRDLSRYAASAVVIVAVAIVAVILWNILGRERPVAPERPFHEVIRENERLASPESTGAPRAVRPDSTTVPAAGDSLTLVAQASDSVWVRMMRDDGLIRDYFFRPGESMTWHAREQFLFFTIGNPDGFTLKLNGQPLALPGPAGHPVQHVVIRSTGIVTPGPPNR